MAQETRYITWLNNLGGFEYWPFIAYQDKLLSVEDTGETTKNIFPQWPKSYGSHADTIRKQTFRRTRTQEIIRSQHLSRIEATRIGEEVRSSVLVQKLATRRDRRTVIVDNSSVTIHRGIDKIHSLSFTISYTDQISGQTV